MAKEGKYEPSEELREAVRRYLSGSGSEADFDGNLKE